MRCARAATAGLVNVSRRRAIGHRAHRNKTVKAKRATAIARRDTVTTSAAREVRIYAALLLVETANPLSGIARAHWGTKPGTGRPTILNKIRDKNCNKTKKYFTALSSFRRMQRWMRVLPSRVACVLNERVGRIDRHFSGSSLLAAAAANEPPPAAGAATTDNEANGSKSRNSRSQVQTWDRPVLVTVTILDSFDSGQFRSRDDVDDGAFV